MTPATYDRMVESGILTPDDHVELLEHFVVLKMPRNPQHDGTIQIVQRALAPVLPPGWELRTQSTVALPDSRPGPDVAVVRGNVRTYLTRHPEPADVGLLIEVANTSLLRDQRDKTRIYARAGIVEYWIVNLDDRCVEVYTRPSGPTAVPAYGDVRVVRPGDAVPLVLDGVAVASLPVDDLLP